ncbi:hypothetical protein D3C76_1223460 [compost metagenome]
MWLLDGGWHDFRAMDVKILAVVFDVLLGPQAFHQFDFFKQLIVTILFSRELAFGPGVLFADPRNQIEVDAPLGHLIEGRDHLGLGNRVDVAGLEGCEHFQACGPRGQVRGDHPGVPADCTDRNQHVVESGVFSRDGHAFEVLQRARYVLARIAKCTGVAKGWAEPAHAQGDIFIHWKSPDGERWVHYIKGLTMSKMNMYHCSYAQY